MVDLGSFVIGVSLLLIGLKNIAKSEPGVLAWTIKIHHEIKYRMAKMGRLDKEWGLDGKREQICCIWESTLETI